MKDIIHLQCSWKTAANDIHVYDGANIMPHRKTSLWSTMQDNLIFDLSNAHPALFGKDIEFSLPLQKEKAETTLGTSPSGQNNFEGMFPSLVSAVILLVIS